MTRGILHALAVVVGVASAVAWALLTPLPWPARALTTFLLVPLPALLLVQARLVDHVPAGAEREAVYVSSAVSVWALAALAMLAARFSDISRDALWLSWPGMGPFLVATAATVLGGLALLLLGRLLRVPESPLTRFLLPRTSTEKIAFAGLSVSAGIAEELVFRAFLLAALLAAGAPLPVAVAIAVVVFALSHAYQGLIGVLRVALLGALLTAPLLLAGSVYPAMAAHAVLDLLAGLVLADWLTGERGH